MCNDAKPPSTVMATLDPVHDEPRPHVLVVEDDARLTEMMHDYLTRHGYEVSVERRGDTAIERIRDASPDVVLLDLGLPGEDGLSVCRAIRNEFAGRIIMLTARTEEVDEIVGLEVGADDYVKKPVSPRLLLARIEAHLRRGRGEASDGVLEVGELAIDFGNRSVVMRGEPVELTTAEFDLLALLARRAGEVLSRDTIYAEVRGIAFDGVDRSIDLRISRLRKKLGDDPKRPRFIKSVRSVGYLFAVPRSP